MGKGWGGGPDSVIYRVSYVNTDRNFNKLYFKHVSACPGGGHWIPRAGPGLHPGGVGERLWLECYKIRLDGCLLNSLIIVINSLTL